MVIACAVLTRFGEEVSQKWQMWIWIWTEGRLEDRLPQEGKQRKTNRWVRNKTPVPHHVWLRVYRIDSVMAMLNEASGKKGGLQGSQRGGFSVMSSCWKWPVVLRVTWTEAKSDTAADLYSWLWVGLSWSLRSFSRKMITECKSVNYITSLICESCCCECNHQENVL